MNYKTISKCLGELEKPQPDISYVRGMLETLLDLGDHSSVAERSVVSREVAGSIPAGPAHDEGSALDAKARASLDTIKTMAAESLHE